MRRGEAATPSAFALVRRSFFSFFLRCCCVFSSFVQTVARDGEALGFSSCGTVTVAFALFNAPLLGPSPSSRLTCGFFPRKLSFLFFVFSHSALRLPLWRMSKEPNTRRYATGTITSEPGVPYHKLPSSALSANSERVPSGAVVPSTSNEGPPKQGPPRLTINNFPTFHARVKKLPPDANTKAAINTKLWQFPEQVLFACAKCRRDRIQSDSVAIDPKNKVVLCTSCFTRIVRPRTYKPSRVVPFPSLLSWLNYKPSKVLEVSEDVMMRPAEAVAPSGNRMALPLLASGDRPTSVDKLPAVGMNIMPAAARGSGVAASSTVTAGAGAAGGSNLYAAGGTDVIGDAKHPCLRIWGVCQHGETCLYRNAPADLCLAYLMGLCRGEEGSGKGHHHYGKAEEDKKTGRKPRPCALLHQRIYDLPQDSDLCPEVRYVGEIEGEEELNEEEESPWICWIARRRKSPNSAEWQLWNNGALKPIFDVYVPAVERPDRKKPNWPQEREEAMDTVEAMDAKEGEGKSGEPGDGAPVKLNLNDILSGLKSIRK